MHTHSLTGLAHTVTLALTVHTRTLSGTHQGTQTLTLSHSHTQGTHRHTRLLKRLSWQTIALYSVHLWKDFLWFSTIL